MQLAGNATKGQITAYAVVGAVMWLAYVLAAIVGEWRRKRAQRQYGRGEAMAERDAGSDSSGGGPKKWFGRGRYS